MKRTLSLLSLLLLASCWPGWDFVCDPTPSREHRVEDLRVLALEVDAPTVLVPPGLLYDDAPAAEPLTVHLAPRVYDPRGGGPIDVRVAVCPAAVFGGSTGAPCPDGARALASFSVDADANAPLGAVGGLEMDVTVDAALVRALYAEAGFAEGSLGVVPFRWVVGVSRTVDGRVERESAYLPWLLQLDALAADMPAARLGALLQSEGAMLCDVPGAANACSTPEEPACADVCLLPPVLPPRVELAGLSPASAGAPPLINETPALRPGDAIDVEVGQLVWLTAVINVGDEVPTLQWVFPMGELCPEDEDPARGHLQCDMGFPPTLTTRFYVGDGAADLVAPGDPTTGYWGNQGGYEAVAVAFTEGTPPGTEESLLVVMATDRDAMGTAVFTLVAR